jgi:four helix bundle protein
MVWNTVKSFRDLKVWEKSHSLALAAYDATANFPKQEMFGLVSQIRRCASSIPANIAEGCGRRGNGEFHRFLQIAMGSASALEYHLLLFTRSQVSGRRGSSIVKWTVWKK